MKTTLLVIDVQQNLIDFGAWNAKEILHNINQLIQKARQANTDIIFICDNRVEPNGGIHSSIATEKQDIIIQKDYCDSFSGTSLSELLTAQQSEQLIICGLQSEYCIDTTTRNALSRGYSVTLIADAHTTFDTSLLSAEQIIAHHNQTLSSLTADNNKYVHLNNTDKMIFK